MEERERNRNQRGKSKFFEIVAYYYDHCSQYRLYDTSINAQARALHKFLVKRWLGKPMAELIKFKYQQEQIVISLL